MHNKITNTISLLLGSLLASGTLLADANLTFTSTNTQGIARTSVIQIQNQRIRMEDIGNDTYTIYDSKKETLYTINPAIKQYTETTIDSIKKHMTMLVENQKAVKAQMREQLSKMPEEQRVAIEEQMELAEKQAKAAPPKIETQASNKTDTIQGISCEVITSTVTGKPFKEVCLAKDGIDEAEITQLKHMFRFMEDTTIETAKIRGLPEPDTKDMPSHQAGFAIKTQLLPNGPVSILSKVSTQDLSKGTFLIPKGFTLFSPQPTSEIEKK